MSVRTPGPADAGAIAALIARSASAYGGHVLAAGEIRSWFDMPELAPEDFAVLGQDDGLVAYADLVVRPGSDAAWVDARVLPATPFGALLDWAGERARAKGARRLLVSVAAAVDPAPFEARGYRRIRAFYEMAVTLVDAPPGARWPDGIAVRTLRAGEEERVHAAVEEAFADHWEFEPRPYEAWLASVRAREVDPSLWFLACDGDELAGVCLCSVSGAEPERAGWVDTLAVRRPWRRRGLGEALLVHAFGVFRARGLERAGLDVDGENTTGAVRLYERAGMHVAHARACWELPLG